MIFSYALHSVFSKRFMSNHKAQPKPSMKTESFSSTAGKMFHVFLLLFSSSETSCGNNENYEWKMLFLFWFKMSSMFKITFNFLVSTFPSPDNNFFLTL